MASFKKKEKKFHKIFTVFKLIQFKFLNGFNSEIKPRLLLGQKFQAQSYTLIHVDNYVNVMGLTPIHFLSTGPNGLIIEYGSLRYMRPNP